MFSLIDFTVQLLGTPHSYLADVGTPHFECQTAQYRYSRNMSFVLLRRYNIDIEGGLSSPENSFSGCKETQLSPRGSGSGGVRCSWSSWPSRFHNFPSIMISVVRKLFPVVEGGNFLCCWRPIVSGSDVRPEFVSSEIMNLENELIALRYTYQQTFPSKEASSNDISPKKCLTNWNFTEWMFDQ